MKQRPHFELSCSFHFLVPLQPGTDLICTMVLNWNVDHVYYSSLRNVWDGETGPSDPKLTFIWSSFLYIWDDNNWIDDNDYLTGIRVHFLIIFTSLISSVVNFGYWNKRIYDYMVREVKLELFLPFRSVLFDVFGQLNSRLIFLISFRQQQHKKLSSPT